MKNINFPVVYTCWIVTFMSAYYIPKVY